MPAQASTSTSPQRWLLVFNCQSLGLGNCLNLLSNEVRVEHYDRASFIKNANDVERRKGSFDRVVIAKQLADGLPDWLTGHKRGRQVPTVFFDAYHPDACYVMENGKPLKGPLGDYHSLLAFSCFALGRTPSQALSCFTDSTYLRLGYHERWDAAKARLLGDFREAGLDLATAFPGWSRSGPFMYSVNHVHIRCLHEIAQLMLRSDGIEPAYLDCLPHDNLANGPIFPVYPEIATRLGARGSYLFKVGGTYQHLSLEDFIQQSYDLYRNASSVAVAAGQAPMFERAVAVLQE